MKDQVDDFHIDLSPNISLIKEWPCKACGRDNTIDARIDTETLFEDEESYCFHCWHEKLTKDASKKIIAT